MQRLWNLILVLLTTACVSANEDNTPTNAVADAPAITPANTLTCENIDPIFEGINGPGFAIAVAVKGEIACLRNFGYAEMPELVPIEPSTRFNIASISKPLTAWTAVSLAKSVDLSLDQPLSSFDFDSPAYAREVSLRQMLQHTSGVRDTATLLILSGKPADHQGNTELLRLLQAQDGLNFSPGSAFLYSNGGYLLTALAMEAATGYSLASLLQQHVFTPAGMNESTLKDQTGQKVERAAKSYVFETEAGAWQEIPYFLASTGSTNVYSTASDLARWGMFFLSSIRSSDARALSMIEPAELTDDSSVHYGLGLETGEYRGRTVWMHSGSEAGYRSVLLMLPQLGTVVAILGNGSSRLQPRAEMLLDALFGDQFPHPAPSRIPEAGPDIGPTARHAIAGYYTFEPGRTAQIIATETDFVLAADPFGMLPMEAVSETELLHAPSQTRVTFSGLGDRGFHSLKLAGLGPSADASRVEIVTDSPETAAKGRFYAKELDAVYELHWDEGALAIAIPGQLPITLVPLDNGEWVSPPLGLAIEFKNPDAFMLHTWRVKNLQFIKLAEQDF
jgi:CubicO group peptidase (beta-lactamase class C family)